MLLHEAAPHWLSLLLGEQIKAQYFFPEEESCKAHCGAAVTPVGTSLGQKMPRVHAGEQTAPLTP